MSRQTLYRFFDATGELLYIGITMNPVQRWHAHRHEKQWWPDKGRIEWMHYPDRASVLIAEEAAIKAEKPRYNVVHNRTRPVPAPRFPATNGTGGRWSFETHRSGYRRQCDLYLYPELDCSSMVDNYYQLDGEGQLVAYIRYLQQRYPEWLDADAVPIHWSVMSQQGGISEAAPFQKADIFAELGDFLTFFTWPEDAQTGELLDWYRVPVINKRFPAFADALAWTPSPLQPTCPLTSIMRSRDGILPTRQKTHAFE